MSLRVESFYQVDLKTQSKRYFRKGEEVDWRHFVLYKGRLLTDECAIKARSLNRQDE